MTSAHSRSIERLEVGFPGGSYPVLVGSGALKEGLVQQAQFWEGRTVFVVTSPTVRRLHGDELGGLLGRAARSIWLEVPDGEEAKSPKNAVALWTRLLAEGGKRDSVVLALGGGSVGDLAGFAAGTFLRGIAHLQLPTTLLGQVDASVGGKTGIDLPEAKNSVGVFRQPVAVLADTRWLLTLPKRELRAGLFEVIKMAALLDVPLLDRVSEQIDALKSYNLDALTPIVARSIEAKIGVVEDDPFETGRRKLLNFGHTLGHALESAAGYRHLLHGEAVGFGMLFAIRLAKRRGFPVAEARRLVGLIRRLGLPKLPKLEGDALRLAIARDKKARESGLSWVLPVRLGEGQVVDDVSSREVDEEVEAFLRDPWAAA